MAGLTEFYCRLNETSQASQFTWMDNTFNTGVQYVLNSKSLIAYLALISTFSGYINTRLMSHKFLISRKKYLELQIATLLKFFQ